MKTIKNLLWITIGVCLVLTWLPYLGVFNAPVLVAYLPQPLALTLACNLILTLCVLAIYPLYFKPFIAKLKAKPIVEEKYHG
ncbi:hypothetical protein [Pseudomonas sp.]|uniref:hypothetical protein n=1 Tax=Pseudomonas sp. TaxID=306 RepID=UPI003A977275